MTKEGLERLWVEKKKVITDLEQAQARMGETSGGGGGWHENNFFEFLEEEIHRLRSKLNTINTRLERAKVVDTTNEPGDLVQFGSRVELDINEEITKYIILGEADSDIRLNIISYKSPIAQAIIGKPQGAISELELPNKEMVVIKIVKISKQ